MAFFRRLIGPIWPRTYCLRLAWFKVSGLGFHAVGVFIILSGWTLMQSTARRAEKGEIAWGSWYWARFLRLYPMYWVAHSSSLCCRRCPPRTGGPSHHPGVAARLWFIDIEMNFMYLNAAWWYFSMLIQFFAIFPLLFWTRRRVGRWWFLFIGCAAGFSHATSCSCFGLKTDCGYRRFRNLSIAGICARDVAGNVVYAITRAHGMVPSSRRGIRRRLDPLPRCTAALSRTLRIHLCRFRHGACCMLEIVGIAGLISLFNSPAKLFGLVGLYWYGLYLTHQPYVIWLGLRIREVPIWGFLLICIPTLAVLSAWGMLLEKGTNTLVNKLASLKKPARS